ncbi:unnamed protein product [Rhizophagus irregularis]|nr:unnamed protein product [Rhizophagus irregularis]CAB5374065.1 unnamed protein product [Rhizophagus irregularis]
MTESQQDFDENVNEKKNQEIKTESTIPVSDKEHDNVSTPNKLDINLESEEITSNVDNQTKPPNALNELIDNEQNSSNFSAISNDDKQTSSPNISIISNEDRQFNPSTTLNNSSPEILTSSNEPNNDKQNSSSNTLNDSSDDKQNSSVISNDDNDKQSNDDKQSSSPNIFNDDKRTISSNISNDDNDKQSSSPNIFNEDKQSSSPNISNDDNDKQSSSPNIFIEDKQSSSSNIFNEDKQSSSPNIFNDDKQTSSTNISNDVKQISQPISPISNDDKKTNSPTISPILIDDKKTNSQTISPISNDDKNNSPTASSISNDNEKINSPTASPISNKLYDNKQNQTTSNEYLNDSLEESIQPSDTNKDSSNSEDDISSNAIMSESEIQDEEYEMVKPADSIEDLSKHETNDVNDVEYSFIKEHDNFSESIIEDPSKHKPNDDDINMNNENKSSVKKFNNNEIVESPSDDEYYDDDDDDSHNESEYTERKEDHKTIEEEIQLPITDVNVSDYNPYIEPKKNEVQFVDQQIRERRRPNQHQQELSSPSENNISLKNSNVRTDTPSISFLEIFKYIFYLFVVFALLYFVYDVNRLSNKPSSLRNIADITNNIFEEINSVELPDINTISDYTVECRKAAIMAERSASFKSYGSQIAKGLFQIGDSIYKSRQLLQYMYSKGSTLRSSFESEIDAILQRLNSNHIRQDDAKYIRDRLDKLTKKIKDVRLLVEKSHNSILDVRKIRNKMDDDITNGLKDAEKYNKNEKYSSDISKVKKELENVDNTLSKLYINVGHLEKLREILNDHEGKLMGVSDELDELEGKTRILKPDIKHLILAVENTKVRNHIFNRLANTD